MQSSDRYDQRIAFYIWANCYYLFYCFSLSVANVLRPYKHSHGAPCSKLSPKVRGTSEAKQRDREESVNAKRPCKLLLARSLLLKNGGYLLSHGCAVPSARTGLTSLFGMGRGGTPTL